MEDINGTCCTLDAGEIAQRVTSWQALAGRALSRDVGNDHVISVYPSDPQLRRRLGDLIAAEAECCSFLKFTVEENPSEIRVRLDFPPETRPIVESMLPGHDSPITLQ